MNERKRRHGDGRLRLLERFGDRIAGRVIGYLYFGAIIRKVVYWLAIRHL